MKANRKPERAESTKTSRGKRLLLVAVLGGVLALTTSAVAVAIPSGPPPEPPEPGRPPHSQVRTVTFSGDITGVTKALPVDENPGHAASLTTSISRDFLVEAFAETDSTGTCTLPDGNPGFLSTLVAGGQEVWNYVKSESAFIAQVTDRQLCVGATGLSYRSEAEIVGGWGEFEGATGRVVTTDRNGRAFRTLGGATQLTSPQLGFYFVAVTGHYEIEAQVPK